MYECIVFDMVGLVAFVAQLEFHFASDRRLLWRFVTGFVCLWICGYL
jgi:hypothetical protein